MNFQLRCIARNVVSNLNSKDRVAADHQPARACRVRALVCFVTRKLLRFWQYANVEFRMSNGRNPARTRTLAVSDRS